MYFRLMRVITVQNDSISDARWLPEVTTNWLEIPDCKYIF